MVDRKGEGASEPIEFTPALDLDNGKESQPEAIEYKVLSREEEARLVDLLTQRRLDQRLGVPETRFSTYFVHGDDEEAKLARETELIVFWSRFDNDPDVMREAYAPYEGASSFILVVDNEEKRPAGVVRVIANSEAGFPSLNDIENYVNKHGEKSWGKTVQEVVAEIGVDEQGLDHTWDTGTLAVRDEYLNTSVALALYRATYLRAKQEAIKLWVAIVDDKVLEKVLDAMSFEAIRYEGVGSGEYLGSALSTPVYTWVDQLLAYAKTRNEFTYALLDISDETDAILGSVEMQAIRVLDDEH